MLIPKNFDNTGHSWFNLKDFLKISSKGGDAEQGGPIANARKEFQQFVQHYDDYDDAPGRDDRPFAYLQEWLHAWVQYGSGAESTGRNYETYLRVCLDVADAAFRGKIDFDYQSSNEKRCQDARPRRIEAIHNPDDSDAAYYADRATYERLVADLEYDTLRDLDQRTAFAAETMERLTNPGAFRDELE